MKIELMVNKTGLPKNGFTKLENEFTRRIHARWPETHIRLRKGNNNNLTVLSASKGEKEAVGKLLEEMFEEADEWLYE
ncbi:DinI family protein [Photobacterium frigidiphilum]|uniref:DinI family protein n=1 Tax=Photobacterium frigidiphilum TaxID=264736 RepID=A0A2T3J746_9GAMM|nr:DinI-like family protein [Photobacterium frigidiphilum]PSU44525.1 DinI family protein [Photobacterium frigidiphilum]PSU44562.1 DinI family protein [Photobacterium frigidiphilum]